MLLSGAQCLFGNKVGCICPALVLDHRGGCGSHTVVSCWQNSEVESKREGRFIGPFGSNTADLRDSKSLWLHPVKIVQTDANKELKMNRIWLKWNWMLYSFYFLKKKKPAFWNTSDLTVSIFQHHCSSCKTSNHYQQRQSMQIFRGLNIPPKRFSIT